MREQATADPAVRQREGEREGGRVWMAGDAEAQVVSVASFFFSDSWLPLRLLAFGGLVSSGV